MQRPRHHALRDSRRQHTHRERDASEERRERASRILGVGVMHSRFLPWSGGSHHRFTVLGVSGVRLPG